MNGKGHKIKVIVIVDIYVDMCANGFFFTIVTFQLAKTVTKSMYLPEIFFKVQASLGKPEKTALDDGNNFVYYIGFRSNRLCCTLKNILICRVHAITYRFYWLLYQASNINSCTFAMHKKTKKNITTHGIHST